MPARASHIIVYHLSHYNITSTAFVSISSALSAPFAKTKLYKKAMLLQGNHTLSTQPIFHLKVLDDLCAADGASLPPGSKHPKLIFV